MNKWLNDFVYRTPITWCEFALAGFASLIIVIVTTGFQAIKAAIENPVKSLRNE